MAGATAAGAALTILGYAYSVEPRWLQQIFFRLGVPDLPAALEGLRIAHLTDFHVGMTRMRLSTLFRALATTHEWHPDVVALTGDFVHEGTWIPGADLFVELAESAPTFAVLGNHDFATSPTATERVVAILSSQGVEVLRNEHRLVPVRSGSGEVVLVGVDDPSRSRDDLRQALGELPDAPDPNRPTILLGHAPHVADRAPPRRFSLILSGHTHGGQLAVPLFSRCARLEQSMLHALGLDSPYRRGIYVVNGNPLFVSNGVGVSRVPFRFLARPQVACFTLGRGVDEARDLDDPRRYLTPVRHP